MKDNSKNEKPGWLRHAGTVLIIAGLLAFLFMRGGCPKQQAGPQRLPENAKIEMITVDGWPLYAEIAGCPDTHSVGLGERRELQPGYGMLFVFDPPAKPAFSMKDTHLALSLAFIDSEGVIKQIEDMEPYDLHHVTPPTPIRWALAVRQGFFHDHGITPGAHVQLPADTDADTAPPAGPGEQDE